MEIRRHLLQLIFWIEIFLLACFLFLDMVHTDTYAATDSSGTRPTIQSGELTSVVSNESSETTSQHSEKRRISIGLRVPNTSWVIRIQSIHQVNNEIWVFSELSSGGVGASVITDVEDSVRVELPRLPVKHFVWGKDWNWENKEDITFVGYFDYYQLKLYAWWSGKLIPFNGESTGTNKDNR